ncbi:MAG: FAD/NAD(P)-binding protein [Deltaproteobacteria bacterium]|jgi:NAD(P)H-flavin reductase|nr:FAD/NAD(P)-binding protein [Deltaproteobacteria bacterium]
MPNNPYLPQVATVLEVIAETPDIKSFRLRLDDEAAHAALRFEPGQAGQLSLFGAGEATFAISSPPSRKEYLQFSVLRAGEVTTALHGLMPGDKVGVRAPLGNHFPYDDMKGKDIILVGGGIGMAPLRPLLLFMLDNRDDYGKISLLYGARSPGDLAYMGEIREWMARGDLSVTLTIDREVPEWPHEVGLVPQALDKLSPSPANAVAITCGPPGMIKYVLQTLKKLKFADGQIYTTLEKRMKCGVGICGRCNIGDKYVCIDGPVFTQAQLTGMLNEL